MCVMASLGSDSTAPEELHTQRSALQEEPELCTKEAFFSTQTALESVHISEKTSAVR